MLSKVKIGDKEIELLSNASTPYRYKQVFGDDLIRFFTESGTGHTPDDTETVIKAQKMAYIMNQQAEGADLTKLSEDGFLVWLEGFEAFALNEFETVLNIIGAYTGQTKATSTPKKKVDQQKEK